MFTQYPWYGMMPPQGGGNNNNPIETMREMLKFHDEMEERNKKKADSAKKPPVSRMFTKLEVVGLLTMLGPFIGYAYLMLLLSMASNFATMMQTIVK